jgi:hypothetical protein
MKPIPAIPEMLTVARRIIWFEPPEKALSNPVRFMAYAMTYALPEDMRFVRKYVSDDDFRDALDHAPPGIIDPRSWAYWNSKMGRYPPPPHPVRRFEPATRQPGPGGLPQDSPSIDSPSQKRDIDAQRRYGARAWLRMREEAPKADLKEVRRRAAQRWGEKYGPPDKSK